MGLPQKKMKEQTYPGVLFESWSWDSMGKCFQSQIKVKLLVNLSETERDCPWTILNRYNLRDTVARKFVWVCLFFDMGQYSTIIFHGIFRCFFEEPWLLSVEAIDVPF